MTTFQNLLAADGTGPSVPSKELCHGLGAKLALADDVPAISSVFLNKSLNSRSNHISPPREMQGPVSETIVKVEDADTEAGASTPASDVLERTT